MSLQRIQDCGEPFWEAGDWGVGSPTSASLPIHLSLCLVPVRAPYKKWAFSTCLLDSFGNQKLISNEV